MTMSTTVTVATVAAAGVTADAAHVTNYKPRNVYQNVTCDLNVSAHFVNN